MYNVDFKPPAKAASAQGAPAAEAVPKSPTASWPMRILVCVAAVFFMQLARPLLLPVAIAVAFTFVLSPLVRRLRRLGIPEAIGAAIVVASVLTGVVLMASTLATPAAEWLDRAPSTVRQLLESADKIRSSLFELPSGKRTKAAVAAAQRADPIAEKIASESLSFGRVVLGQMFSFAVEAAATVILLYFLLASEHWLLSRTVEAVRRRRTRALVLGGVRQAQREIGLYLGTMTLINMGLGICTALAMAAIGVPNPPLWGALAAVMNYVPYLGPAVVTGVLLLAGSITFGTSADMLGPPAAFLALHAIESNFVTPWVVGRRLRLAPLSVFLSVMVMGWLWGIAGAFVAVPIVLGLRTIFKRSRRFKLACVYFEGDATPPPSLRSLLRVKRRQKAEIG
jgi:predicted PurR-regulated permease PerM